MRALVELYDTYTRRLGRQYGWVARPDFLAAVAALLGVLVFGTLPGLFIGIGVSLLLLIYRASRPYVAVLGRTSGPDGAYHDMESHPDARPPDGIVVLRIESGLYFANAENVRSRILGAGGADGVRGVVVDAETTPFIDVSAARMLVARARGAPGPGRPVGARPHRRAGTRRARLHHRRAGPDRAVRDDPRRRRRPSPTG